MRKYRLGVLLSNETDNDSPKMKEHKRRLARCRYRALEICTWLFYCALAVVYYFIVEQLVRLAICPASTDDTRPSRDFCNCLDQGHAGTCLFKFLPHLPALIPALLPSAFFMIVPLIVSTYRFFTSQLPLLRRSKGMQIYEEAKRAAQRPGMSEQLGFMHMVLSPLSLP